MQAEVEYHRIQEQQALYYKYADAAEKYRELPNLDRWDAKEKALETYNAFVQRVHGKHSS